MRGTTRGRLAIAILVMVAFGCGASRASAAWPGQNGLIVFSGDTSSLNQIDEIWAIRADGTNLHRILPDVGAQNNVIYEVSPDGTGVVHDQRLAAGVALKTLNIETGVRTLIDQAPFPPPT
jgi:hypothetical protein